MMSRLKIAVQKSGRLSEKSLEIIRSCGIKISNGDRKLITSATNFPIELLFLRDDDIPQYVEQGVADVGILGENVVLETGKNVVIKEKLGFASCRMSLAIPRDETFNGPEWFNGKRIATSYPVILSDYLFRNGITAETEVTSGSVEVTPGIGLADAIFDIVSTGSTLLMNGLKEVEVVSRSEAVLISSPNLTSEKSDILSKLLFRIRAVKNASENKYILLNAPNKAIPVIAKILPGMKSPTVLPLEQEGWSSIHSVVREDEFWEIIDRLREAGAEGILVIPIEKMIL